jgi:enoyl-CoA hydratase
MVRYFFSPQRTKEVRMSVQVERKEKVMTIILNRPERRNAVDGLTAQALADAFREFENDSESWVAVLWGAGGHFCAGADLKAITGGKGFNRIDPEGDGPMGPSRMVMSKPVIAAVAGYAVAGGLELACWCDLRVMEKSAVFGVFCRRWGVPLIDGGTVRLPRLIGMSRAMDLILTGRPVEAPEAHAIGLANYVVEDGQSREEAEKLAMRLAEFPQVCMRNDRLNVYGTSGRALEEAMKMEFQRGLDTLRSKEFSTGVQPFVQGKGRHGKY